MLFHLDQDYAPKRSLLNSRTWTDLSIKSSQIKIAGAKRRSEKNAEEAFDVARKASEGGSSESDSGDADEVDDLGDGLLCAAYTRCVVFSVIDVAPLQFTLLQISTCIIDIDRRAELSRSAA